jgi:tRNA (mo5U34)-methyltransferase
MPDRRIDLLDSRYGLGGRRVLEVGCFEGLHTVALCEKGAVVTAVDARVDNVVKTLVRLGFFGYHARVLVVDVEAPGFTELIGAVDWVHHVGVLYHLKDPVSHIDSLGSLVSEGIMLDTHFALPEQITGTYTVGDRVYPYRRVEEFGKNDVFSGMYDHSKWLLLEDIVSRLGSAGFRAAQIEEIRNERNGPRALIFARRDS